MSWHLLKSHKIKPQRTTLPPDLIFIRLCDTYSDINLLFTHSSPQKLSHPLKMSSETKPFLYTSSNSSSTTLTSQHNSSSSSSPLRKITRSLLSDIRSNIVSYTIVFAFTTLLWMSIVFTFIPDASSEYRTKISHPDARKHNVTSGMKLLTCGESKTNEEAIEMGCKYDVLLNGWVPEECYDEEFVCLALTLSFPFPF